MLHKQARVLGLKQIEGENGENTSKITPSYLMKNEEKFFKKIKKKYRTHDHPPRLHRTQHVLQCHSLRIVGKSQRKGEDLSNLSSPVLHQRNKSFKIFYSNLKREQKTVKDSSFLSLSEVRKKPNDQKLSRLFTYTSSTDNVIDPNDNVLNTAHTHMAEETLQVSMENSNCCGIHPSVVSNQRVNKKTFINEVREEVSGSIIDLVTTLDQICNAFIIDDDDIDKCVKNIQKASHDFYTIQSTNNLSL